MIMDCVQWILKMNPIYLTEMNKIVKEACIIPCLVEQYQKDSSFLCFNIGVIKQGYHYGIYIEYEN